MHQKLNDCHHESCPQQKIGWVNCTKFGKDRILSGERRKMLNKARYHAFELICNAITFCELALAAAVQEEEKGDVEVNGNYKIGKELVSRWFGTTEKKKIFNIRRKLDYLYCSIKNDEMMYLNALAKDFTTPIDGIYAYTWPGPYFSFERDCPASIYLGPMFWKSVFEGHNCRSGVLIHELSHAKFGCQDVTYGEKRCRSLPYKDAVNNADNFEYFCEDAWAYADRLKHYSHVNLEGCWKEITIRHDNKHFMFVHDVYHISKNGNLYDMPSSNLSLHAFGIVYDGHLSYDNGIQRFETKIISTDIIQGTFRCYKSGYTGTVWLKRAYFPNNNTLALKDVN
eukprot:299255_1